MSHYQVAITDHADAVLSRELESGQFGDAGAVMSAALLALEREREDEARLVALRQAIEEGFVGGTYEGDAFEDLRVKYGFPPFER